MNVTKVKDYAYPCMMAEKSIKKAYEVMINGSSEKAIEECTQAITYIANMMEAIKAKK
jgi:hypothetical protein